MTQTVTHYKVPTLDSHLSKWRFRHALPNLTASSTIL